MAIRDTVELEAVAKTLIKYDAALQATCKRKFII